MKKFCYFSVFAVLLASCANDEILDSVDSAEREVPISFQVSQKNMTRAALQETGHYNFGVWAYKNTDATNAIMDNYLVGYMDGTNKKGYSMVATNQTTLGDAGATADGTSMWAYEKMGTGTGQYEYAGTEGYYKSSDTKYMSNKSEQWLKYWDYSSANTEFFAYAPYINSATAPVTFASKKMTFPANSVKAGYDDLSQFEYMYAYTKQLKADYKKDVRLAFKRMNSKIQIKFYEEIDGYTVDIIDLKGNTALTATGVQATPAVAPTSGTTYTKSSTFYDQGSAVVDFSGATPSCTVTGTTNNTANLNFLIPTTSPIGTTSGTATPSPTIYYGLPLGTSNKTGFTFHISYKLTAEDTGETIYVNNATVHVPCTNVQWAANTSYTYIFKIVKNSSGTTDSSVPTEGSYTNPTPDTSKSLYPIIFDNCTVEDWTEATATEHTVNN